MKKMMYTTFPNATNYWLEEGAAEGFSMDKTVEAFKFELRRLWKAAYLECLRTGLPSNIAATRAFEATKNYAEYTLLLLDEGDNK